MPPKQENIKTEQKRRKQRLENKLDDEGVDEAVDNARRPRGRARTPPLRDRRASENVQRSQSVPRKRKRADKQGSAEVKAADRAGDGEPEADFEAEAEAYSESEDEANAIVPAKKQKTSENPYFVRYTPHLFYVLEDTIFRCLDREKSCQ